MKPTLFIGSSSEGEAIALLVKKHLSHFADCTIWRDIFPPNENYLVSLNNALSLYEYGVLVATADDKKISRKKQSASARDNVIFEFGLFMGRLGKQKAFMIKEKNIILPSDLAGVSIPTFTDSNAADLETQIENCCRTIVDHIQSRTGLFDGGIYPSIPLAYGYYHNSILPACERLRHTKFVKIKGDGRNIESFKFKIIIPGDLRHDLKKAVEAKKLDEGWIDVEIPAVPRSYNFYISALDWENPNLTILDIPTTLNSLHQPIREFVGTTGEGRSSKEDIVEKREILSFQKVVESKIQGNPLLKNIVETVIEII